MNYLDELLTLYPDRDWYTQRYLLTHLSTLGPGLESDTLLEFLWGESASPRTQLRHMARRQLGRVLPTCLRQSYGLEQAKLGVWTAFAQVRPEGQVSPSTQVVPPDLYDAMLTAGWHRLSPLLARTLELLGSSSERVRVAASLVAGRIQTTSGLESLSRGLIADRKFSFGHAAALADLGGAEAATVLLDVSRKVGTRAPDLLMLLADIPVDRLLPVLTSAASGTDQLTATSIALALSTETSGAGRDLLYRLVGAGDGWVMAFALDALSVAPAPSDLDLARKIYAQCKQEFLQVLAVKLAGGVSGSEPVAFLSEVLDAGSPRVQAAALEALARKKVDPGAMGRAAALHINSPLLKLKVSALLVLSRVDPAAGLHALTELLESEDDVQRVEGAYALGYLRAAEATSVLGDLAIADPRSPVRMQAIKSLAKHDPAQAIPLLAKVANSSNARVAALAARALSSMPEHALGSVIPALEAALAAATSNTARGVLVRSLGIAASRAGREAPTAVEAALESSDQVLLGALEGTKCLGPGSRLITLTTHADPRVRFRAAVGAFLDGQLAGANALDALLQSSDEDCVLKGLQGLLEVAILLPSAVAAPRFTELRAALEPISDQTAVQRYASNEKPRVPTEATVRPPQRPVGAAPKWEPVPCDVPVRSRTPRPPAGSGASNVPKSRAAADQPLKRKSVEGATYLAGMPEGPGAWREFLYTYRQLVAAAAVLMFAVGWVLVSLAGASQTGGTGGGGGRAGPIEPGSLRVSQVKGKVTSGPVGKAQNAVSVKSQLAPGEKISTGPDSKVFLSDGKQNAVVLGESSSLVLGVASKDAEDKKTTAFLFTEPEGDVLVDFRKADVQGRSRIEFVLAGERVVGQGFTVRMFDEGAERSLNVVSGEPDLIVGTAAPQRLQPAQTVKLKAH